MAPRSIEGGEGSLSRSRELVADRAAPATAGALLSASCGARNPSGRARPQPEHRESGQVHGGREQPEVGVHLGPASDPGPSSAVATAHEVAELALDLGP